MVKVSFTAEGLEWMKTHAGATVRFKIVTTVKSVPENGIVSNGVFPIVNDYDPYNEQGDTKTPPVITDKNLHFGAYTLKKVDDQSEKKPLAGATFALYEKQANVACTDDAAVSGTPVASVTSGNDGLVKFEGILLGEFPKEQTTASKTFCLKETVAPVGFVLPGNDQNREVTLQTSQTYTGTVSDIVNTKQTGPNLPMTGATGTVLLMLSGIAVAFAAVGLYTVNSRRKARMLED